VCAHTQLRRACVRNSADYYYPANSVRDPVTGAITHRAARVRAHGDLLLISGSTR
jgi:hypothetical protein